MSLTSFLDLKDVKAKFRETFAKPLTAPYGEMQAAPLSNNYILVGTAFDYLLRFYLEYLYPSSQAKYWIAEAALASPLLRRNPAVLKRAQAMIQAAREYYKMYLDDGQLTEGLLRSSLLLAQIDPVFRRKVIVPDFGDVSEQDIADLRNLINLVTPGTFKMEQICLLDPTFGAGSLLVGGADVDLVIDDTIIDIKTTINPKLQRQHFDQVLGYYVLYRLGGVDGMPKNHLINQVGLYSARYGNLRVFPIRDLVNETDLEFFCIWFVDRAQQEFGTNFEKLKTLRCSP